MRRAPHSMLFSPPNSYLSLKIKRYHSNSNGGIFYKIPDQYSSKVSRSGKQDCLRNCHRREEIKGIVVSKYSVVSWIGSWNRKMTGRKNWWNLNKVCSLDNSLVPMPISCFIDVNNRGSLKKGIPATCWFVRHLFIDIGIIQWCVSGGLQSHQIGSSHKRERARKRDGWRQREGATLYRLRCHWVILMPQVVLKHRPG